MDELIRLLAERPEPFEPGLTEFWTDERLMRELLAAHLDAESDAASRRPETIAREAEWLADALGLGPGASLLDLGCGPGLYALEFARRGLAVTGIDISAGAIAHARAAAESAGLDIRYVQADYRTLAERDAYDAAVLIYYDFGVLHERDRAPLLERIHAALRPGSRFALDAVSTQRRQQETRSWSAQTRGFWRDGPHLLLERTLDYPERDLQFREHAVLEPDGHTALYRFWEQRFSPDSLGRLLEDAGFQVELIVADLSGSPYQPESETLAVVATR